MLKSSRALIISDIACRCVSLPQETKRKRLHSSLCVSQRRTKEQIVPQAHCHPHPIIPRRNSLLACSSIHKGLRGKRVASSEISVEASGNRITDPFRSDEILDLPSFGLLPSKLLSFSFFSLKQTTMLATRSLLRSPRLPGLLLASTTLPRRFVSTEPHSYQRHPAGQSPIASTVYSSSSLILTTTFRSYAFVVERRLKLAHSTLETFEASRTIPTLSPGLYREGFGCSQSRLPPATNLWRQTSEGSRQFVEERFRFRYWLQGEPSRLDARAVPWSHRRGVIFELNLTACFVFTALNP